MDGEELYARAARVATSPLGLSVERREIRGLKIGAEVGADRARRAVLVVGGVHGDEPSSTEAVIELGERLLVRPHRAGAVADAGAGVVEGGLDVWLVPALNPDGLARNQKNNARDVDLNRNFPAHNFSRAHAPGYDPGPAPLSEPEAAVLARLLENEDVGAVVAVHAPFACVNFDGPARAWADAVSAACGWPVRESIGYPTPGSLGTWLGVDRGVPILTLELPGGALAGFRAQATAALDAAIASARDLPLGGGRIRSVYL